MTNKEDCGMIKKEILILKDFVILDDIIIVKENHIHFK